MGGLKKFDILGSLPLELAQKVLKYLKGEDLENCSMVCRKWWNLTNNDYLWRRIVKDDYPEELKYLKEGVKDGGRCPFRQCYDRGCSTVRKWSLNERWELELDEGVVSTSCLANGGILVLTYKDTSLKVLDFNDCKRRLPVLTQELPPFSDSPVDKKNLSTHFGEKMLIFERRFQSGVRFFYSYKWENLRLWAWKNFGFWRNESGQLVGSSLFKDSTEEIRLNRILGTTLILNDVKKKKVIFWDPGGETVKGEIDKPSGIRDFSFEKIYFLCNLNKFCGYNENGEKILELMIPEGESTIFEDIGLQFNKEVIMVELTLPGELTVGLFWNVQTKLWMDSRISTSKEITLHPKEKVVLFVDDSESDLRKVSIVFKCILTLTNLQIITMKLFYDMDDIFTNSGHLSLVHYRYILYIPDFENEATCYREHVLVDSVTRHIVFHEKSKDFKIRYVGGKLIQGIKIQKGKRKTSLWIYT